MIEYSQIAISSEGLVFNGDTPCDNTLITGLIEVEESGILNKYLGVYKSYIFFNNETYIFY